MKKKYPKCIDCRYLSSHSEGKCIRPHRLTGLAQNFYAQNERGMGIGSCGKEARFFEPKEVPT